jgi:rfaE bifunctional protein kinase chain/domain
MNSARLAALLERFPQQTVLVVGDFFLDKYLDLDPALSETSLETGLEAYQVANVRCYPGAAGTVTNNLRALDVQVLALGVIGDDGEGDDLLRALARIGVDGAGLLRVPSRFTPTYLKPMLRQADGPARELNRLDTKNRTLLPAALEDEVIARLRRLLPHVQGVVISDQATEANCGVITDRVRAELSALAAAHPSVPMAADSRGRIGLFRQVMVKPNAHEAAAATGLPDPAAAGRALRRLTERPVVVTHGDQGVYLFDEAGERHVPAVPVTGPIDVCGAGDSTMAGLVATLCAGGTLAEAALVGNLTASLTIQQLGVTGTASRAQVLARLAQATATA